MIATITSKGQITIPKAVREHLHLRAGDRVDFSMQADGTASLRPIAMRAQDLYGVLSRKGGKVMTVHEMERKAARLLARDGR